MVGSRGSVILGQSKPELTVDAASQLGDNNLGATQTAPLQVPPGCSASVDVLVRAAGDPVTAPSDEPPDHLPPKLGSRAASVAPTKKARAATEHD